MSRKAKRRRRSQQPRLPRMTDAAIEAALTANNTEPDWSFGCEVCGQPPVLPITGMCGPCTFGEADTAGGNW